MVDFSSELGIKARSHLASDYFVWFTTLSSSLIPQPRPVWFVWYQESVVIYSQANAKKILHLKEHPGVSLHFNTIDKNGEQDVIVFTGTAAIDPDLPRADHLPDYLYKYAAGIADLGQTQQQFGKDYSIGIRIKPTVLRGGSFHKSRNLCPDEL